MKKGLILLPTLNRPQLLDRFMESFKATTVIDSPVDVAHTDLSILVDGEDWEKNKLTYIKYHQVFITKGVSMGAKCREAYEKLSNGYAWIGVLNDDHFCITPGWDKIVEELLDGTNMVSTNDGFWNFGFNVVGLTAWSTPLLAASGIDIFPPGIDHWFIDNIWKAIGDQTGCWVETMRVNIEHRHAFIGKMEQDDTFRKSQDPVKAKQAQEAFNAFMQNDFKAVCERITQFRAEKIFGEKFT